MLLFRPCALLTLSSLPENDTIYWVDMGLSTISRAKRDQTWREDVITNGIGRVEGITVDWIAGLGPNILVKITKTYYNLHLLIVDRQFPRK